MNVELLRAAIKLPVNMNSFFIETHCETVGCIAGNIIIAAGLKFTLARESIVGSVIIMDGQSIITADKAKELADLPNYDLFYVNCWPVHFQDQYISGPDIPEELILHDVVESYIATDGWRFVHEDLKFTGQII